MNITRHTKKSYLLPCTPADLNRYDKFFGHYFISYHIYFRCGRDHRNPPRVINMSHLSGYIMSMASWKWDVTPVRWQWSHISCNKNDKNARSMIVSFLSNRRQRVKILVEVSNWSTIKRGVTSTPPPTKDQSWRSYREILQIMQTIITFTTKMYVSKI